MMRRLVLAALLALAPIGSAYATNCSSNPFTLTNGQTADATQVMANFNNLLNCGNNNLAHNGANSDITSLAGLTTPLSVLQGGTGATTFAANGLIVGNGSSAPTTLAPSTSGNLLQSETSGWVSTNVWPGYLPTKATPLTADLIVIGDSAAPWQAKTTTITALATAVVPSNTLLVRAWGNVGNGQSCNQCSAGVSVAKNGTGDYTVTTGVTMSTSNYSVMLTIDAAGSGHSNAACQDAGSRTQTTFEMFCQNGANTLQDNAFNFAIFGN